MRIKLLSEMTKWNNNMSPRFHLEILPFMRGLAKKSFLISQAIKSHDSEKVIKLYNLYQRHLKLQDEIKQLKKEMGFVIELENKELSEIYNALCSLNIDIRKGQPKRAKFIQKLIQKWDRIKEFYDDTKT